MENYSLKHNAIYSLIKSIFGIVVVISNLISTKMILLPYFNNFSVPAGLITYPLTFFISDFITEMYRIKKAKEMIYHAFGMIIISYLIIKIALILPSPTLENQSHFEEILGLNGTILIASLTAYIISQTIDIHLYATIKKWTGSNHLWIRNNGSTWIAQLADTTIVNLIHLKIGVGMDMAQVLPIMLFSYTYKCTFSLALTPAFYAILFFFKKIYRISAHAVK